MTDKQLLSAYIVRPLEQSKSPVIAYALPCGDNCVTLYGIDDRVMRTMALDDLYSWALCSNVIIEPPVLTTSNRYTQEDDKAYRELTELEDSRRHTEIDMVMLRLRRLLRYVPRGTNL